MIMGTTLKDNFGRKHNYLRLSLTDKCNLRCFYCMPENIAFSPSSKLMSATEIQQIASTFVDLGVKKIRLTGGEPLARKDFGQILTNLSQLPVSLHLSTNGVLLHNYKEELINSPIKDLNISLDSLNPDKFKEITRRDEYNQVIENIHWAIDNRFKVKINVVLMRSVNEDEILDFVEFAKNNQLDLRFIEFMPFGGNDWSIDKRISHDEVVKIIKSKYEKHLIETSKFNHATSLEYSFKDGQGSIGLISTVSEPFCSNCNRVRLTADGKMKNCLFSKSEVNLLAALRNNEDIIPLIYGDIKEKKEERGVEKNTSGFLENAKSEDKRSMVKIGG